MREIKFRGYQPDKKEWIYGYLVVDPQGKFRIYQRAFEGSESQTYYFVNPESVGQFTGLKDKNGVEIYEGDIVKVGGTKRKGEYIAEVIYEAPLFKIKSN